MATRGTSPTSLDGPVSPDGFVKPDGPVTPDGPVPVPYPGPSMGRPRSRLVMSTVLVLVGIVGAAILPAAADAPAREDTDRGVVGPRLRLYSGPLQDLTVDPSVPNPFRSAHATVAMAWVDGASSYVLQIRGASRSTAGASYGAHLHSGPCLAGDPDAAGLHYNLSRERGEDPVVVSDQTEVWLDFVLRGSGTARSAASVPFVPTRGDRSVVVHAEPTDDTGAAGPRLACLPIVR